MGAAKITLRTGDIVETATDIDKVSEGDELLEARTLFSVEGNIYQYQFSLFLPGYFPVVPHKTCHCSMETILSMV